MFAGLSDRLLAGGALVIDDRIARKNKRSLKTFSYCRYRDKKARRVKSVYIVFFLDRQLLTEWVLIFALLNTSSASSPVEQKLQFHS